ncbi:MAG TPA: BrnA antitoxin family protein [Thermohalobaculum sp.]|nr:BrnA antitoxin family protein [Thermohalobaculum sp.]
MSEKHITRISREEARKARGRTDWGRLRSITDEELERRIAADPESDAADFDWANAELVEPRPKQAVSIRLDQDVIEFFKAKGRGYQTRINAVLRSYIKAQKSR